MPFVILFMEHLCSSDMNCDTYVFIDKLDCLRYLAFMACDICDPLWYVIWSGLVLRYVLCTIRVPSHWDVYWFMWLRQLRNLDTRVVEESVQRVEGDDSTHHDRVGSMGWRATEPKQHEWTWGTGHSLQITVVWWTASCFPHLDGEMWLSPMWARVDRG